MADGCYLRVHFDAEGRAARLHFLSRADATHAEPTPIWFVEVRESAAHPPAVNLLAFEGLGQPPGALLDETGASNLPLTSADQRAALRWWPATGEVDQIYVAPEARRSRLGTRLVLTASCLSITRGWPRLWSDGQRTELGEAFVSASAFRHRTADLSHLMPPMTPPSD